MYFNFDDSRPDTPRLDRSLTPLEQLLLTLLMYAGLVILMLVWPNLPFVKAMEARREQAVEERLRKEQEDLRNRSTFVFVAPKVEIKAIVPPKLAELSDRDRRIQAMEKPPDPKNLLPYSRGNSPERIISDARKPAEQPADRPKPQPRGDNGTTPQTTSPNSLFLPNTPDSTIARNEPSKNPALGHGPSMGVLSEAIRDVQRYSQGESLQNVQGNGDFGPSIQFDTKGVEFGPWLRRFIAQIRRNWFVPYAAMSLHGHVVLTFTVHKDGSISDLQVARPSTIDAFTNSAYSAIKQSNPTMPLPPEYPDDRAAFTVTFYFNETPSGGTP